MARTRRERRDAALDARRAAALALPARAAAPAMPRLSTHLRASFNAS